MAQVERQLPKVSALGSLCTAPASAQYLATADGTLTTEIAPRHHQWGLRCVTAAATCASALFLCVAAGDAAAAAVSTYSVAPAVRLPRNANAFPRYAAPQWPPRQQSVTARASAERSADEVPATDPDLATPAFDPKALARAIRDVVPFKAKGRPSMDDVQRISEGRGAKKRGTGSRSVPHRLNSEETQEFKRAQKKGFVEMIGKGFRRGGRDYASDRVGNPLANTFRQRCDATVRPYICLQKASLEKPIDTVQVDASTLRLTAAADYEAFFRICDRIAEEVACVRVDPGGPLPWAEAMQQPTDMEDDAIWKLAYITAEYVCPSRGQAKDLSKQLSGFWDVALPAKVKR